MSPRPCACGGSRRGRGRASARRRRCLLCEYAEAYPDQSHEDWAPYRVAYPDLFVGSSWRLPCLSHVIRSEDTTILVDTGVGPPGLWGDWTPEEEGVLPESLAALGLAPEDVDIVFFTHLHVDHVGWNTDPEGTPLFPRARHVLHADALASVMARRDEPHIRRCVEPLIGVFEEIRGDVELAQGVVAFGVPGHASGHMALRIWSSGSEALILADAVPHPAQLQHPDWRFAFDDDPVQSARTRGTLVGDLEHSNCLVVCGHYPGSGIGRVVTRGERKVWEEVAPEP